MVEMLMNSSKESFLIVIIMLIVGFMEKSLITSLLQHDKMLRWSYLFRYTSLVDRYIPNIAACLKDSAPLVRRQTLTLLTHLLQVLCSEKVVVGVNAFCNAVLKPEVHFAVMVQSLSKVVGMPFSQTIATFRLE